MIVYHGSTLEVKSPDADHLKNRERTIEELRYYKKNNQIAIKNKKAIDKTLHFLYSYEVK